MRRFGNGFRQRFVDVPIEALLDAAHRVDDEVDRDRARAELREAFREFHEVVRRRGFEERSEFVLDFRVVVDVGFVQRFHEVVYIVRPFVG